MIYTPTPAWLVDALLTTRVLFKVRILPANFTKRAQENKQYYFLDFKEDGVVIMSGDGIVLTSDD